MDFRVSNGSNTRKHSPQGHPPTHTLASRSPPLIARTPNESLENLPGSMDQQPLRRARADTMPNPSFPYAYLNLNVPTAESTRHRSGSVTSMFGYDASPTDDSASSTVASTLASLGLDDENTHQAPPPSAASHHSSTQAEQQEEIVKQQRNRAYTVAAAALPQQQQHQHQQQHQQMSRLGGLAPFTPFSPQTRSSVMQRPRAISLGMVDGGIDQPQSSASLLGNNTYGQMYSSGPTRYNPHQQAAAMMLPTTAAAALAGGERTLRNSRSSGNLMDLNNDVLFHHHHRGFSRMTSQSQLGELPELAAAKEFYSRGNNLMEATTSSSTQNFDASPPSAPAQIPSRALWLGNINPSVSVPDLVKFFSDYGRVESARILSDKECAFVNFTEVDSAIDAKTDLEGRLGSTLAGTPVRVGYGKADVNVAMALTSEAGPNAQGPTRALWVGNIPANMNPAILRTIFQPFGSIDSVRVLSHKNCGFVNFEHQEDAVRARKSLQNKEILGPGTGMVRIGFAKAPSANEENDDMDMSSSTQQQQNNQQQQQQQQQSQQQQQQNKRALSLESYQATQWATAMMMTRMIMNASGEQQTTQPDLHTAIIAERKFIMQQLGCESPEETQGDHLPLSYSSVIPGVPEMAGSERKLDPLRLREMRKRLDVGPVSVEEAEAFATECKDEIVELCSDYIGNTVVQRIFENCSDQTKQTLLERIAPHLASIGVHKNGTWAAQKIIDHATTPSQIQLIRENLTSYVPLLLLDQFGNYVVQCCLNMGSAHNRFIFDAIVEKCWEIGQGRFGARAVRAILENPSVTKEQQMYVAAAIVQNAVLLATDANGTLLLIWYLDAADLQGRFRVLCPRLLPYLGKLCTHKLGSMIALKIIHQQQESDARNLLLKAIFNDGNVLDDVLRDQVHGVTLVQKILGMADLEKRDHYAQQVKDALTRRLKVQHVQSYKKLFDQLDEMDPCTETAISSPAVTTGLDPVVANDSGNSNDSASWMQNPQTVAMMANMYAAAMTAATTLQQQEQPPKVNTVDLAQFDSLLKTLLKQQEKQQGEGSPQGEQVQESLESQNEKEV